MTANAFIENYKTILTKKYARFEGRAARTEFWSFFLVSFIAGIIVSIVDGILGLNRHGMINLNNLYAIAIFIPNIALWTRRLHDIGKSGWWQLLFLIPIIGWIILIIWMVRDSQPGANTYGANPKRVPPVTPAATI